MSDQRDNRTTVERDALRSPALGTAREPRAAVVVYAHDDTRLVELCEGESILVGRAPPSDLVVEDMTISRQHARFTYREGQVHVEDLGSRNGTLVRGVRVANALLRSGDDVRLGEVAISIHLRGGAEPPLGISSYDQLLGRLEDELVRARTFGHQFALVAVFAAERVEARGAARERNDVEARAGARERNDVEARAGARERNDVEARAQEGAGEAESDVPGSLREQNRSKTRGGPGARARVDDRHVSRWAPRVRDELRPVDAIAVHGPYSVLVLMPESNAQGAERVARRIARLSDGLILQCGIATYPETAKSAGALVSQAHTAARSASSTRPVQHGRGVSLEEQGAPVVQATSMQRLYALADRIAGNNVPVLILGETGTGKEVIARHVHRASPRGERTMVVINCAALPANLIESALFGHEKGAFTGADAQKKGVFEEGDQSTVFLDEVGELSPAAQAALLRVLETKRFSRVGSAREIEVDTRIFAATHRDLEAMVEAHTFRADLYYRLNTMTLKVPPLRDRKEEIEPLARAFLAQTVERWNTSARDFAPATLELLCAYRWPGNVRELRNVLERAAVICTSSRLEPEDLPERVRTAEVGSPIPPPSPGLPRERVSTLRGAEDLGSTPFRDRIRDYEVKLLTDALEAAGGNQSRAAEILRMPLRTLVHKIRTYGLKKTYRREEEE